MILFLRYLAAALACLVGGTLVAFVVVLCFAYFQGDEGAGVVRSSKALKWWFTLVLVFCSVHLSSRLVPHGRRRFSSLFTGAFLLLCFVGTLEAYLRGESLLPYAVPILKDAVPFVGAAATSWYVHSRHQA